MISVERGEQASEWGSTMAETGSAPRILVVDDELNMCLALERLYRRAGYEVKYCLDSEGLYKTAAWWQPSLVVLDVRLAREDGREVARNFRTMYDVPIMMLTGKIEVQDRIRGLESGADDYVCKPYDPGELVARTRALLRRYNMATGSTGSDDLPIRLDRKHRKLTCDDGSEMRITEIQCNIMAVLMERKGEVISRELLYSMVFKRPWVPGDRSLDVHVSNLRKAIGQLESPGIAIQSIRNIGYQLVVD